MEIKKKKNPVSSSVDSGAALQASAESSFRVYYGATGAAVPFKWESQPGTPKHSLFSDSSLPPLTPPPSYFSAPSTPSPPTPKKKKSKGTAVDTKLAVLLHTALPRLVSRTTSPNSHSSSSSSSSSSMYYSPSPSTRKGDGGAKSLRRALTCFGLTGSVNRSCGYPVSSVKNALFSVVACRRSPSVDYIV